MILNASGGLRVGLDIEPMVSNSVRRKKKKFPEMSSRLMLEDILYITKEWGIMNMGIIKNIIDDYQKMVKTQFIIPLNNGDTIKFVFNRQDLPHLLGLQHLVDIPILFEYNNDRVSATDLMDGMCDGTIDVEEFEKK